MDWRTNAKSVRQPQHSAVTTRPATCNRPCALSPKEATCGDRDPDSIVRPKAPSVRDRTLEACAASGTNDGRRYGVARARLGGKRKHHLGARAGLALRPDSPAMGFDDAAAYVQAEA